MFLYNINFNFSVKIVLEFGFFNDIYNNTGVP